MRADAFTSWLTATGREDDDGSDQGADRGRLPWKHGLRSGAYVVSRHEVAELRRRLIELQRASR
jgi:hypothetical protein